MITTLVLVLRSRAMVSRIVLLYAVVGAAATLAAGCGGTAAPSAEDTVVATLYPLAFAASRVAPPGVRVVDLAPPGAEPHNLELAPRDIELLREARLVVYLGGGFQPAVDDVLAERGPAGLFDARERGGVHEAPPGEDLPYDPHLWLDPLRLAKVAHGIATALGAPEAANLLRAELESLHWAFDAGLGTCERRTIVTSHAAFGYLADRYDLVEVGLAGLEPEPESGPETLARLIDRVKETGATTVFYEPLSSGATARVVAREAGVETAVLDPVESLTDAQRARGEDYFTVMSRNLVALREALGCT